MVIESAHGRVTDGTLAGVHTCAILTMDGGGVTEGRAVIIASGAVPEARVTELTRPGALLNLHIGKGMRVFRIRLGDGRLLTGELVSATWQRPGRRLCRFLLHEGGTAA